MNEPRLEQVWGSRAATGGAACFAAIVTALHAVQPRMDPASHLISELASRPWGSAMVVAFTGLAVGFAGLQVAICSLGGSKALRVLLAVAALSFFLAGVITLDRNVGLHLGSVVVGFASAVLSIYELPNSGGALANAIPRAWSLALGLGVCVGVALGFSFLPVGIGQRIAAFFLLCWLMLAGRNVGAISV